LGQYTGPDDTLVAAEFDDDVSCTTAAWAIHTDAYRSTAERQLIVR
jgi:hypothetical protein